MPDLIHTYYQNGQPHQVPLPHASIWQMLQHYAHTQSAKTAIIAVDVHTHEEQRFTYSELFKIVTQCANYLHLTHHINTSDHISFAYDNRAETIVLNLAAAVLGAASSPLDIRRDVLERMTYKLSLTNAKVFITQPRGHYQTTWHDKITQLRGEKTSATIVEFTDTTLFTEIATQPEIPCFTPAPDLDSVHVTLFTSGTTAHSKGAQLTSRNLLANAPAIQAWLKINAQDTFAAILPLHHANSTTFCLCHLAVGATLLLLSEPPKEKFWQFMAQYQATITSIVQKIQYELLDLEKEFNAVKDQLVLSRIQIGSDVVDPAAAEKFVTRYNIPLQQGYGLTELALRATGVPYDLPRTEYLDLLRRNTIGETLYGTTLAILDEQGNEVAAGVKGEICLRGQTIMKGYINDPTATTYSFANNWFHTGDLGWYELINGRKMIFYHSRVREIIKKGGALLSPAAIDQAIRDHFPELTEAASFGYPSKDWGEDIWLIVTFKPQTPHPRRAEVLEQIVILGKQEKIAGLPKFEAPSRVLDWAKEFNDQPLPMTSTLKIQRTKVKEAVLNKYPSH